ncbi:MAG: GTP-binding protein [Candidatus Lokiarchaeota archaeon]|nr:GTP-binding protein [Candidatus Lokiarchaeota archaeon]
MDKFKFKITVIGDGFVGKSSLIKKFTQGSFQRDYIKTIGAQFSKYDEEIEGDICELVFWDIAGQDEFHFLRPAFYKSSLAAIIVFSIEENNFGKESLKHTALWFKEIKKFCGDIPIILFGNKVDLVDENTLNKEKILKFVKKNDFFGFYPTSAKTGQNVEEAFRAIIKLLYDKVKNSIIVP